MKKSKLIILICSLIGLVFWVRSCEFLKTYDLNDLTSNYDEHENEIRDLIVYLDSILAKETFVNIAINDLNVIDMFHIKHNGKYENNWNVDINSKKCDSLLLILGWTKNDIKDLKLKMDLANCISISNFNNHTIGYKMSLMSKFSYKIYDENLNDLQISQFNDQCEKIFYRDNVVLEYGSGATGSICFPERFKKIEE